MAFSSSSVSLVMFLHLDGVLNVTQAEVSPTRLSRTKSSSCWNLWLGVKSQGLEAFNHSFPSLPFALIAAGVFCVLMGSLRNCCCCTLDTILLHVKNSLLILLQGSLLFLIFSLAAHMLLQMSILWCTQRTSFLIKLELLHLQIRNRERERVAAAAQ